MISLHRYIGYLVIIILVLNSCNLNPDNYPNSVVAKVGSEILTEKDLLDQIPTGHNTTIDTSVFIEKKRSEWIRDQLLLQHGKDLSIESSTSYQSEIEKLKRELVLKIVVDEILTRNPEQFDVSIEEATEYFQQNRTSLSLDEDYVRIRPFTSSSLIDAQSARRALLRGDSWESIVSQYSINRDEQLEYESLFIPISQAFMEVPSLNRILPNLGITEVSEIVQYQGAHHFLQLLEVKPKGESGNLDWTIKQIQRWLREEKKRKYLNSYIRNLYLQAESTNDIYIRDVR